MQITFEHVDYIYQPGTVNACQALRDINLSLSSGELTAVIGHGGSGKSTLSLLMAGLYQPTAGQVKAGGLVKDSRQAFRQVALVFQYPEQQLFGETVFEEVAFGARNYGTPEDYLNTKVRQSLVQVGLDPELFWHRSPFSLSGGQKRRVCIASMLVFEPKVIILDEPTAGLDEGGRRWMMDLVKKLHGQGRTVVWITHNMAEAAELAQRIIVLNRGAVMLDGTPAQVFSHEEKLLAAGLDIPEAARLVRRMKREGVPVRGQAVTVRQAYREILGYLNGRPETEEELAEELLPQPESTASELRVREWRKESPDV